MTLKQKPIRINSLNELSGYIPPSDTKLEVNVLGALVLQKTALYKVIHFLKPHHFFYPQHVSIYQAILNLHKKEVPVDSITVVHELKQLKLLESVGGAYYISTLTNTIASSAHVEEHARIILQLYIERKIIEINLNYYRRGIASEFTNSLEFLDSFLNEGVELSNDVYASGNKSNDVELNDWFDDLNKTLETKETPGTSAGYVELDETTNKMQNGDLIIVAARPGMGKTGFVLSVARNVIKTGKAVAMFSMEMSFRQIMARMAAMEFNISSQVFLKGNYNTSELAMYKPYLKQLLEKFIVINDRTINPLSLKSKSIALKHEKKIGLIIIDYLQLMSASEIKAGNREAEVSHISRELKRLAGIIDVPIIALSQLSREVEKRQGKKPQLSDLRESGAIEQDADMVLFIYRPEYYGEKDESKPGLAEIIVGKNRGGAPLKNCALKFIPYTTQFVEGDWEIPKADDEIDLFNNPDNEDAF